MRAFFKYKVKFYIPEDNWKFTEEEGLLVANSFKEAAEILEDNRYDNLETIEIDTINDDEVLSFEDLLGYLTPRTIKFGQEITATLEESEDADA